MTDWDALERELDAWGRSGETATLWWRDDDAVAAAPALRRLLALATTVHDRPIPLCLAVVPALAEPTLPAVLSAAAPVAVLQHGYAHVNHASARMKKAEFAAGRRLPDMLAQLRAGQTRQRQLFADVALPILVPPWNRIDPALVARLPEASINGLSTYGPRDAAAASSGVTQVNAHVDIIDWHGGRRFGGAAMALRLAIDHLTARRQNRADPGEPTGLLTHHLVHDDDAWEFLDIFLRRTSAHPAVRWLAGREVFAGPGNGSA